MEPVTNEELFAPLTVANAVAGFDIDADSALIVDRCLTHVRNRLASPTAAASDGTSATMAAHLDDVAACRDQLWQYIYHPKNKALPPNTNLNNSGISANQLADIVAGNENASSKAFDVLRMMEQRHKDREEAEALARAADIESRSMGTNTEPSSGDAVMRLVKERVTASVREEALLRSKEVNNEEESTVVAKTNEDDKNSTTVSHSDADAIVPTTADPKAIAKAKALQAKAQRTKETLLALFESVKPDPLLGALPHPTSHFGNDPYSNKRSTNLLLLKYLGVSYPGGKSALREQLPFFVRGVAPATGGGGGNKSGGTAAASAGEAVRAATVDEAASIDGSNASLDKTATKKMGGRALVLYEDRRRRAFLSAITTQLGGGVSSPATFANFVKQSRSGNSGDELTNSSSSTNTLLRIGGGNDNTTHDPNAPLTKRQRRAIIQQLYNLPANPVDLKATLEDASRPVIASTVEYILNSFTVSPFDHKHYTTKLFGFIQPTGLGVHTNFPLVRFNVFELDHLPTPADKLRATIRRLRAVKAREAAEAKKKQKDVTSVTTSPSTSSSDAVLANTVSSGGGDSEELLLKKWSLCGTIFPARNTYHVKAIWSRNAKLSLAEAQRELNADVSVPDAGHHQQHPNELIANEDGEVDEFSTTNGDIDVKSDYRLGLGPKEKGLVTVALDTDRVRAIEITDANSAAVGEAAAANAAATSKNNKKRKGTPETIVRPLTAADRIAHGSYQDSEVTFNWRRFWNPRWSVEGYVRHVESIPSAADGMHYDGADEDPTNNASSAVASLPPSATLGGVRIRADHRGHFFLSRPSALLDMWFAPLKSSSSTTASNGWASAVWATNFFLDPIQRHCSLRAQMDFPKVTVLPLAAEKDEQQLSSSPSLISLGYRRLREALAFDLRIQVATEFKNGGDVAAFYANKSQQQLVGDEITSAARGITTSTPSDRLQQYVRAVKLPHQSTNTVRGAIAHEDTVYGTRRMGGNWYVTSSVELSKPISFIGGGTKSSTATASSSSTEDNTTAPMSIPPLRFVAYWNGLWSASSANNKETIGYAIRREPHVSRKEMKGWYNEYLPTTLECSWSSLWSRQQQQYTGTPSVSDVPAGTTFYKFMKCGAVWDI